MDESPNILLFLARKLVVFLGAILLTYVLAVLSQTGAVVASLAGMGIDLPIGEVISMYGQDLSGMLDMFLPLVAFGLLIAFMTTALLRRYIKTWPHLLYALAGATAMLCLHLALNAAFSITPIAVGRSFAGLASQALAGALGGALYFHLTSKIQRTT